MGKTLFHSEICAASPVDETIQQSWFVMSVSNSSCSSLPCPSCRHLHFKMCSALGGENVFLVGGIMLSWTEKQLLSTETETLLSI